MVEIAADGKHPNYTNPDVGLSIELGSGVAAAQAYLAEPAPLIALRPAAAAR